jgi:hypothetical protein
LKLKFNSHFHQVAQKAVELDRYKTREDELRVEDSIKEGMIQSLRDENKTFALKLAELQEKETRTSNEVEQ